MEPTRDTADIGETRTAGTASVNQGDGYSRTPADLPPGMSPGSSARPPLGNAGGQGVIDENDAARTEPAIDKSNDGWMIQKATSFYSLGRSYLEANITSGWERNLYHFRGEHASGSVYARRDWKRARTFRPKTRANVKAQEAAAAAAAFATADYLDVQATDPTNQKEVISAAVNKSLVQKRLELAPWSWFITAQGAFQDTKNYGICISHQYWKYKQIEEVVPAFDDTGMPILSEDGRTPMGYAQKRTVCDMPCVDLIEPECMLFEPTCDWRNPMQSAGWLTYLMGMTAGEVLEFMGEMDPKTQMPAWRKYSLAEVLTASSEQMDNRVRRAREGKNRIDPAMDPAGDEYTLVWVHLNISRQKGVDVAWFTLGTQMVLTDPMPLTELYPHLQPGERPFTLGFSVIESHRNYPDGDVAQIAPLQEEINSIANQRLDNVRLVLNKRYFIRRGSQMDLEALMRNVPGGAVMTNDPTKDVEIVNTPDVTGSSYQEQDRLAADLDDLVGGFGQASIKSGGKQMDRSGSMDVLQGAAGAVQDYGIKIFFESWMQPVLRQLVRLEQMYETDPVLLQVAGKKANLWDKFGMSEPTDELLQQNLTVTVNVGVGNTDPVKRVQKLVFGVTQVIQLPDMQRRVKSTELADEIMGALGYKDSSRFFMNDQELAEHMKTAPPTPPPPEIAVKMQELSIRQKENDQRNQRETTKDANDHAWRMQQLDNDTLQGHLKTSTTEEIAKSRDKTARDIAAAKEGNRLAEVNMKRADGAHERVAKANDAAAKAKNERENPKPPGKGFPPG